MSRRKLWKVSVDTYKSLTSLVILYQSASKHSWKNVRQRCICFQQSLPRVVIHCIQVVKRRWCYGEDWQRSFLAFVAFVFCATVVTLVSWEQKGIWWLMGWNFGDLSWGNTRLLRVCVYASICQRFRLFGQQDIGQLRKGLELYKKLFISVIRWYDGNCLVGFSCDKKSVNVVTWKDKEYV